MLGLKFIQNYEGKRIESEFNMKPFFAEPYDEEENEASEERADNLSFEIEAGNWAAINPQLPESWRVQDWKNRPVRFVDGKDVGKVVLSAELFKK